jgi:hypothetical protein
MPESQYSPLLLINKHYANLLEWGKHCILWKKKLYPKNVPHSGKIQKKAIFIFFPHLFLPSVDEFCGS